MTQKTFENIITSLSLLLAVLIPAVFSIHLNSVFTAPKLIILQVLVVFMLLVCGYYVLKNKKPETRVSIWEKLLLLYVFLALISSIFSINIYSSFFGIAGRFAGTFTLIHFAILGILVFRFFPKNRIPLLLNVTFTVSVLIALYSIMQYYGLIEFEGINWTQKPTDRAFGTFGHANHLAAYLSTTIAISIGLLAYHKKHWQRALIISGNLILLSALMLTGSRGGFAALILTLILLSILLLRVKGRFFSKKPLQIFYITLGLIIVLLLSLPLAGTFIKQSPLLERSFKTIEVLEQGQGVDRISWWKSSFEMFKDNPLSGTGYATFQDAYNGYRRLDYRMPDDIQDGITPQSAHNEFINTLATQGIAALLAYLLMIFYPVWRLLKYLWQRNLLPDKNKYPALSILGGLSVYILQTQLSFGVISTMTFLYIFLGLGMLLISKEKRSIQLDKTKKIVVLAVVLSFSFSSLTFAGKLFRAEYFLQKADSSLSAQDKEKFYEKAIKSFPWQYSYYSAYGDYTLGAITKAGPDISLEKYLALSVNNYKKALDLNDHSPVLWANYANSLLTYANYKKLKGEEESYPAFSIKGFRAFEKAAQKGPNNPVFTYHFAQALEKFGLDEEAEIQYQKTLEIRENYRDSKEKLSGLIK